MTVLDTDYLSVLERSDQPGSGALRARLAHLPPSDVVTTIISYENRCEAGWRIWHVHGPWRIRSKPIDGCCSIWTTTDGFQFYRLMRPRRHLLSASVYCQEKGNRFAGWAEMTGTKRAA
jgi:hypothetical protein